MQLQPMICSNCGKTLPKSRFDVYCTCRALTEVKTNPKPPQWAPCHYRGELIGTANCGCQGKSDVYWCNKQQGHCTLHATGKSWFSVETEQGKVDRVGKLLPCLHCPIRTTAKKLLDKSYSPWQYITNDMLAADVTNFAAKLPPLAGVAGIPVSGMLVAPFIATLLHIPLYEASEQYGLRPVGHGSRGSTRHVDASLPILVIDDTVSSGGSMLRIKQHIGPGNYLYAAIYAKTFDHIDYYGTELDEPHLLEWNLPNTGYVRCLSPQCTFDGGGIAIDFDGVLCPDPPRVFDESTEREEYLTWISNAPLGKFVPRMFPVPDIVSYRCEYTRPQTEAWLHKHGIKFDRLHLWPGEPDTRDWRAEAWKGKFYAASNHGLFVESSEHQAKDIARFSGKKVLCTDTGTVYAI